MAGSRDREASWVSGLGTEIQYSLFLIRYVTADRVMNEAGRLGMSTVGNHTAHFFDLVTFMYYYYLDSWYKLQSIAATSSQGSDHLSIFSGTSMVVLHHISSHSYVLCIWI